MKLKITSTMLGHDLWNGMFEVRQRVLDHTGLVDQYYVDVRPRDGQLGLQPDEFKAVGR